MPRITLVKLVDYRKWTEELGFDREGLIQIKQAEIYRWIQERAWSMGFFAMPLMYDHYLILTNGISREELIDLAEYIEEKTPCSIKVVSITHKNPAIAQLYASRILQVSENKITYIDGEDSVNVIAHIDLNDITSLINETSIYEAYLEVNMLLNQLSSQIYEQNGLVSYLGGDNFVAILPSENYEKLITRIPGCLKVGVGVSINPREAFKLATEALTRIRKGYVKTNYLIIQSSS
uniref:GTP cyclohydrolase III n=1 Tax=Staphylothermus marinus TaxID=2280 RepID=A0A7C4NUX6_STAMA